MTLLDTTTVVVDSIGRASFKAQMIGKDLAEACATNGNDVEICKSICIAIVSVAIIIAVIILGCHYQNKKSQSQGTSNTDTDNNSKSSVSEEPDEKKERKRFLDFCYSTVQSNDFKDNEIKKSCWTYLKKNYIDKE